MKAQTNRQLPCSSNQTSMHEPSMPLKTATKNNRPKQMGNLPSHFKLIKHQQTKAAWQPHIMSKLTKQRQIKMTIPTPFFKSDKNNSKPKKMATPYHFQS